MVTNKKAVSSHANGVTLDSTQSLKFYPESKTKKFLKSVEKRAKDSGLIPKDYDLLSKYKGRQLLRLDEIETAASRGTQSKGLSAFLQRVKELIDSFKAGYQYELPPMIVVYVSGMLKALIAAGDHRKPAMVDSGYTHCLVDVLMLDIKNDPYDRVIYDLISTNTNNHPPQWGNTNKELIAFIYSCMKRGNARMTEVLEASSLSGATTFAKKEAYKIIESYKSPISKSSLQTILKGIHQKMSENGHGGNMFKNFVGEDEFTISNAVLGIDAQMNSNYFYDVEIGLMDRYMFDITIDTVNKKSQGELEDDECQYIVLKVTTSDFAITVNKLNEKRKSALHSLKLKSSARNCVDNFNLLGIDQDTINGVKIIGCRPQHVEEAADELIRIDEKGNVYTVPVDVAMTLPSMVI
jgi:hypothetical protein